MFEIKFKGDGFDKIKRDLESFQKKAKEMEGTNSISFHELFTPEFLKKYTRFISLDEMFEKSGFTINSQEDFEKIPEDAWDKFISTNSKFNLWKEMLDVAGEEWVARELFGK